MKGFRAYGAEQTLNLPSDIAAVWGPNSKGKTSLAEAFEFLLTGALSRRELMASSQDEFADALRNVHLPPTEPVFVAATLVSADGAQHTIKRTLISDYAKKQDCQSRLEIDGAVADQAGLAVLGIALSQPPLAAPVLAQHTLSYIFSVRPQDRATYFKALLEVTDLDDLRNEIAGAGGKFAPAEAPLLVKFDKCAAMPALSAAIGTLRTTVPNLALTTTKLDAAVQTLITGAGEIAPSTPDERIATLDKILSDRRAKKFPVEGFKRSATVAWTPPDVSAWEALEAYLQERAKVDVETRRLTALFWEALKVPAVTGIGEAIDCPLCTTPAALTPERIQVIRADVANTQAFTAADNAARAALAQLSASAATLAAAAAAVLPNFLQLGRVKRRGTGFTVEKLKNLLGTRATELLPPWLAQIRPMSRAAQAVTHAAKDARDIVAQLAADIDAGFDPSVLRSAFDALEEHRIGLGHAVEAYNTPANAMLEGLNQVLDAQSDTAGWQEVLDLAQQPAALRRALIERKARATLAKELETALKQIDQAKEQVLDDKFSDYSGSIQNWWERLRPDEHTFFAEVKPRKGARRTIDFKAGLSSNADRSAPKMRDVIAVFSQSQLHCLGLALFLARAQNEGVGFIVLDDPVLSSDDDYRNHFNMTVLSEILKLPMQVIVVTQDHGTWQDIEVRYRYLGISTAQLYIDSPAGGTIIENTSDALSAKINRAKSLARGGHPDVRKECGIHLRDGTELFCKELLVKDHHAKGNTAATLSDYDGKVLEWLAPHIEPLLTEDPSHQGKFGVLRNTVNRACHDNAPPGSSEMVQACGELAHLAKVYLVGGV